MIIECHACEARVDAKVVGESRSQDEGEPPWTTYLLTCPGCGCSLVGGWYDGEEGLLPRLWPKMESHLDRLIPEEIRNSLAEATICFKAKAYNASTVMAGRALEGVCRHFGTEKIYLGPGIQQLREKEVIDARLARWAGELQKARNLSAHASGEKVSRQDAQDLLDFVRAICEYVFVLTRKYDNYMSRKTKAPASKQ
ncbi:MAG TPA: DUF4145 domain-containing protein [Thermoanaerobaculia bacterium]|jgi:hypothetical protein|nr:DUF4145 domain-containing protein [Thermoanaerobaculia bacterium]